MTPIEILKDGVLPDAGHCAVEVTDDATGAPILYASFWPELDSLLGRLARPFAERPTRHPPSLQAECDPELGYMQRPPDHVDALPGLPASPIIAAWERLQNSEYSLRRWNCSSVAKYLLVRAMPCDVYEHIKGAERCSQEDLAHIAQSEGVLEALAALPAMLIDCQPEDVHRLAAAYRGWVAGPPVGPPVPAGSR